MLTPKIDNFCTVVFSKRLNMLKRFWAFLTLALLALTGLQAVRPHYPMPLAHRGGWIKDFVPENSLDGVVSAARYGFPALECDVKYTKDKVMVLMHDKSINRTMRCKANYGQITEVKEVSKCTFRELRDNYVLASNDPEKRKPIPTLEEFLLQCKQYGVMPMLHSNVYESYQLAQKIMGDRWICFNREYDQIKRARQFSKCRILLDPRQRTVTQAVEALRSLGGDVGMSSMEYKKIDADYISTMHDAGFLVQSSIWPTPHEMAAIHDGADMILSDFCWFPVKKQKPYEKWTRKHVALSDEPLVLQSDSVPTYGGMTLQLTLQGEAEITLDSHRTYHVKTSSPDTYTLGLRLYKRAPRIEIRPVGDCTITRLQANCYSMDK